MGYPPGSSTLPLSLGSTHEEAKDSSHSATRQLVPPFVDILHVPCLAPSTPGGTEVGTTILSEVLCHDQGPSLTPPIIDTKKEKV